MTAEKLTPGQTKALRMLVGGPVSEGALAHPNNRVSLQSLVTKGLATFAEKKAQWKLTAAGRKRAKALK